MRVQESYIGTFDAQMAAPGLFGGFSFHGLKKGLISYMGE